MNNLWAFGEMRESNDLLDTPNLLRHRMVTDGYLLLRDILVPQRLNHLRRSMVQVLRQHRWLKGTSAAIRPVREGEPEYLKAYDDIQRIELFHNFAHNGRLMDVMTSVVGPTAFPHPLKIARIVFPNNWEVSTPPHQDYPNNQGTAALTTAWIPLHDTPRSMGSVAVLPGSHLHGVQPLEFHLGAGNRQAMLSPELSGLHWVTTDFRAGDLLLFSSLTMHAALNNATRDQMRLSVDYRFQSEGEELTDLVLEPHFGRQSWEEIYQDWETTIYQYYWKRKRFTVVPFDFTTYDRASLTDADVLAQKVYTRRLDERWSEENPEARLRRGRRLVFDDIPGLGPRKKKRLVEELGGIQGVASATLADLEALPWLPNPVADVVHERLQERADLLRPVEAADGATPVADNDPLVEVSLAGEVRGLGPRREERLVEELGGYPRVVEASLERLQGLSWLPADVATALHAHLHPSPPAPSAQATPTPTTPDSTKESS